MLRSRKGCWVDTPRTGTAMGLTAPSVNCNLVSSDVLLKTVTSSRHVALLPTWGKLYISHVCLDPSLITFTPLPGQERLIPAHPPPHVDVTSSEPADSCHIKAPLYNPFLPFPSQSKKINLWRKKKALYWFTMHNVLLVSSLSLFSRPFFYSCTTPAAASVPSSVSAYTIGMLLPWGSCTLCSV